jgi:hypothetical protein
MGEKVNQALFFGSIGLVMDTKKEEAVNLVFEVKESESESESIEFINLTIEDGRKPVAKLQEFILE